MKEFLQALWALFVLVVMIGSAVLKCQADRQPPPYANWKREIAPPQPALKPPPLDYWALKPFPAPAQYPTWRELEYRFPKPAVAIAPMPRAKPAVAPMPREAGPPVR